MGPGTGAGAGNDVDGDVNAGGGAMSGGGGARQCGDGRATAIRPSGRAASLSRLDEHQLTESVAEGVEPFAGRCGDHASFMLRRQWAGRRR